MTESTPSLKCEKPAAPGVVLAAADDAAHADLSPALVAEGYRVWSVQSGLEAMSTFLEHTGEVDAFLLVNGLPDVRSDAFARRLQAHFPGVPCVFVERAASRTVILRAVRQAIAQGTGELLANILNEVA